MSNPFLNSAAARTGPVRPVPHRIATQRHRCFPELAAPFHRAECREWVRITIFSARPSDPSSLFVVTATTRESDTVTNGLRGSCSSTWTCIPVTWRLSPSQSPVLVDNSREFPIWEIITVSSWLPPGAPEADYRQVNRFACPAIPMLRAPGLESRFLL